MNTKRNRHYAETHERIVDAVLEALETEDIRKVTVTRICSMLRINRSTFYEHFNDVYDVLEQTERELTDAITERIVSHPETLTYDDIFRLVFEHVQRHRLFYRLYLRQGGTIRLSERIIGDTKTWLAEQRAVAVPRIEMEYRLAFFTSGMNALIALWLERGCAETIDELLAILRDQFLQSSKAPENGVR